MNWLLRKRRPAPEADPAARARALACIPVVNDAVTATTQATGSVRLEYALQFRPWFVRLHSRLGGHDAPPVHKKLDLDDIGSAVWAMIDGTRSVADIAAAVARRYGLHHKEAELSVTAFMKALGRRGIIALYPPQETDHNFVFTQEEP